MPRASPEGELLRLGGENARTEAAGYPALSPLLTTAPAPSAGKTTASP